MRNITIAAWVALLVSVIALLWARHLRRRREVPAFLRKLTVSKELAEVIGDGPLPRTDVVKKLWAYIRKNNLQDPKERRMIVADEKLRVVFGGRERVDIFEINKLVNSHLGELDPSSEPQKPQHG
jgi:upstream activation factor subunit UAF30